MAAAGVPRAGRSQCGPEEGLGGECAPPQEPHVSLPVAGRVSSACPGPGGTWRGSPPRSGQPPGKACLSFHKRLRGLGRLTVSDGKFSAQCLRSPEWAAAVTACAWDPAGPWRGLGAPHPTTTLPQKQESWRNGLRPGPWCSCQPRQIQLCFHIEAGVFIPVGEGGLLNSEHLLCPRCCY